MGHLWNVVRRPATRKALACAVGGLSIGCTSGAETAGAPQKLIVAYAADEYPLTLNRERLARYPLNANVCETLVTLGRDFSLGPGLASRWESLQPDGVRFHLRPEARFADGTPVSAGAVVHTMRHAARLRLGYSFLTDSSARAIDDSTIEIRSSQPNRRLLEQMVHPTYGVIAASGDPATRPLCTGAYRVAQYVPHDHLTVVRNVHHAGPRARVDTVVFRFIPDENTRALVLRAGEVDIAYDVGSANASALATLPGFRVVTAPAGAVLMMYINRHGQPPFHQMADESLRRGIAHALDRSTLAAHVLGSTATPVPTVGPPGILGEFVSRVRGVSYDTAAARRLIGASRRPLRLIFNPGVVDRAAAEYVQAQLAQVGLAVVVEALDAAVFESRLNSGTFDLDLETPNQNDANPSFLLALRWYSRSGVRSAIFTHASAHYDSLIERSLMAPDLAAARRAAAEAMHQLVDVEVGAIPLAGISRTYAMRAHVRGFAAHPSRLSQNWSDVWIEK